MIIPVVQIVEGRPKRHFPVIFFLCISAVTVGQNIARSVVEAVAHHAAHRNRVRLGRFMSSDTQTIFNVTRREHMKLIIKREQNKALLGGMSFILKARVELTPEESDLIKKYKAHKQVLLSGQTRFGGAVDWRIENLTSGVAQKCKDVGEVINTEELLKEACGTFKTFLEVMASFGGEEVIEF